MAIGTSDGEYYPSSLENVLAGLTTQEKSREPKNRGMDFFRDMNDENQFPGNPPLSPVLPGINDKGKSDQDPNLKIRRVEEDIPKNAQPAQYLVGLSNQDAADKDMKLSSEEKNLYDTHLKNLIGSGGVDNEDGSRSSLKALTVSGTGDNADKTYIVPTVVDGKLLEPKEAVARADKMGLDKFPSYSSQEEADKRYAQLHDYMEKDTQNYQSIRNTYSKVTDFLDNLSDMKGAENWSPREIIGHALATGMNALGIEAPKGFALKSPGVRIEPVSPKAPANENVKMSLREQLDKAGIKSMSVDEYKQYQADRKLNPSESDKELAKIQEAAAEWAKDHPPTSSYERALENQKAGKMNPAGDTADEFIKSLRSGKPNIKLVTENPTQEPQGRPIPGEQARTQEAQRAANDRNYQMGKGSDRVNVGQGKGVLNDNKEEVQAMIRKGHKPSEIAERFDITPLAVRSWIKRNGSINTIDDILK